MAELMSDPALRDMCVPFTEKYGARLLTVFAVPVSLVQAVDDSKILIGPEISWIPRKFLFYGLPPIYTVR